MTGRSRLFISAGEVSGEHHAARVVEELRRLRPDCAINAFGGRHLEEAGARLLFPLTDFAVLGFLAVFKSLSEFIRILGLYSDYLDRERPDAVVLVDYPGLHIRFAALAHRRGIPVVYYACPQLWAWAPWRARRFARFVDHALTILPFEEEYFRRRGIDARYVGHPAADRQAGESDDDGGLESQVRASAPVVAILPGSRPQETRSNLPLMLAIARKLKDAEPDLSFFLPMARDDTRAVCEEILGRDPLPSLRVVKRVAPVLRAARFALVASGTVTFEVARHSVPMVVLYRITKFQQFMARQLITVPWISQVNLIAGRELVPEFVTPELPVDDITAVSLELLRDTERRAECVQILSKTLGDAFGPGASERAAGEICRVLDAATRTRPERSDSH